MISPMIFPLKRGIPQPPMFLIAGRVVYVLYLAHGSFVGKNIKPHTDQVGKNRSILGLNLQTIGFASPKKINNIPLELDR